MLYDGPVPTHLPVPEFRRIRSAFIAAGGFAEAADIERGYAQEDAAVESWDARDETVLWFEHDLYDQLLLVRLLSMLPPDAGAKVSLVCSDTYLGPLKPDAFPPLFETRRRVSPDQIALGKRTWHAFGADTPRPLLDVLDGDSSALPFLAGALRRHFEDYPDAQGLSRSERQILSLLATRELVPRALFAAWTAMEEQIFMGDWTFWGILRGLATGPAPLLEIFRPQTDATGSPDFRLQPDFGLADTPIELTVAGRDVLAGRADRIALNGIDRWMGGVHLTPAQPWRRSPGSARPASS